VYVATLAPGVTFWDAGELIAAVHSFGVPHPPGAPLFVLIARAASDALAPLPRAVAVNLLSALSTAAACGILAWLTHRWTRSRAAAFGAGVCAGSMSTVWLNATESEVYAVALLLVSVVLFAADMARETGRWRWLALAAYAIALAVPVHVGALVVVPAAVVLVAQPADGGIRWSMAGTLAAVGVLVLGVGLASPVLVAGAVGAAAAAVASQRRQTIGSAIGAFAVAAVALSALAYLPIRAAFDPAVNFGDPRGWGAMWELVGRRQYGAHNLWPRQAPLWAQAANLVQYLDWQVALGVARDVAPSGLRSLGTVAFGVLTVLGASSHRRRDARSWLAYLILVACGTVGLVVYLNFKAGASLGYGVLPDSVPHEVRERDYFFAVGFWSLGGWAGMGAVTLARRLAPRAAVAGIAIAALPIVLNWRAVDRAREPGASLPREMASAMLTSVPPRGVLVTWGDNDSFPLWYLQEVEGVRRDVTVVVAPLLGTRWYREQLARRHSLVPAEHIHRAAPYREMIAPVARAAERQQRPLAMAITVPARHRDERAPWVLRGLAFVRGDTAQAVRVGQTGVLVDTVAASQLAALERRVARAAVEPSTDPTARFMVALLGCPAQAVRAAGAGATPIALDTRCNFW
jgi:hypothetical protein